MRRLLTVAYALGVALALAAGAGGQTPPPTTPTTPPLPPKPKVIFTPRDLRMSLAGRIRVSTGCTGLPGDLCSGGVSVRLLGHVDIPIRQHPAPNGSDPTRRLGSFTLGTAKLLIPVGAARVIDVRLTPRARKVVRTLVRVNVQLRAAYHGRSGRRGTDALSVAVYVPHAFRIRR